MADTDVETAPNITNIAPEEYPLDSKYYCFLTDFNEDETGGTLIASWEVSKDQPDNYLTGIVKFILKNSKEKFEKYAVAEMKREKYIEFMEDNEKFTRKPFMQVHGKTIEDTLDKISEAAEKI